MPSNQRRLVKRIIERDPTTNKLIYNFGIFESTSHGTRQLVAVVEGSYTDAIKMLKAGRTASGNTFVGYKKLKEKK